MSKVMRKEARHTQMLYRASGVHPDIFEHLPRKKTWSLPTVLLYALTCDFTGGKENVALWSLYQPTDHT